MESLLHAAQQQAEAAQQTSVAAASEQANASARASNCQEASEQAARELALATELALAAAASCAEFKNLALEAESQAAAQVANALGLRDAAVTQTLEAVSAKDNAEAAMAAQLTVFAAKEAVYVADNARLAEAAATATLRHAAENAKLAAAAEAANLRHVEENATLAAAAKTASLRLVAENAKLAAVAAEFVNQRHVAEYAKLAAAVSANLKHTESAPLPATATATVTHQAAEREHNSLGARLSSAHLTQTLPAAATAPTPAAAAVSSPAHSTALDQSPAWLEQIDLSWEMEQGELRTESARHSLDSGIPSQVLRTNNEDIHLETGLHTQSAKGDLPSTYHKMQTPRQVTEHITSINICETKAAAVETGDTTLTGAGTQILYSEEPTQPQELGEHMWVTSVASNPAVTGSSASAEVPFVPTARQLETLLPGQPRNNSATEARQVLTARDALCAAAAAAAAYSEDTDTVPVCAGQQKAMAAMDFSGPTRGQQVQALKM